MMMQYIVTRGSQKSTEVFDIDGFVQDESVPPGKNVTGHFYVHVLQTFR
jgi:hypothetical protein